jgi:hypothetical protein
MAAAANDHPIAGGHDTVATSDSLGRVILSEHPDRGKESFRYDARGSSSSRWMRRAWPLGSP